MYNRPHKTESDSQDKFANDETHLTTIIINLNSSLDSPSTHHLVSLMPKVKETILVSLANTPTDKLGSEIQLRSVVATPAFKLWTAFAFSSAVHALFDIDGDLIEQLKDALYSAGLNEVMSISDYNSLKWALLRNYIYNIICQEDDIHQWIYAYNDMQPINTEFVKFFQTLCSPEAATFIRALSELEVLHVKDNLETQTKKAKYIEAIHYGIAQCQGRFSDIPYTKLTNDCINAIDSLIDSQYKYFTSKINELDTIDVGDNDENKQTKRDVIAQVRVTLDNNINLLDDIDTVNGLTQVFLQTTAVINRIKLDHDANTAISHLEDTIVMGDVQLILKDMLLSNIKLFKSTMDINNAESREHLTRLCKDAISRIDALKENEVSTQIRIEQLQQAISAANEHKITTDEVCRQVRQENLAMNIELERLRQNPAPAIQIPEHQSRPRLQQIAMTRDPVKNVSSKWLTRIALGLAGLIGIAAIIAATLGTGGIILLPIGIIIAGFVTGGCLAVACGLALGLDVKHSNQEIRPAPFHGTYQRLSNNFTFGVPTHTADAIQSVEPDITSSEQTLHAQAAYSSPSFHRV